MSKKTFKITSIQTFKFEHLVEAETQEEAMRIYEETPITTDGSYPFIEVCDGLNHEDTKTYIEEYNGEDK